MPGYDLGFGERVVHHGHLPQSFEVDQQLAAIVGMIVITWAHAENAMGFAVGLIFNAVGPSGKDEEIPISLKRRLPYLRRVIQTSPRFDALHDRATELAEGFSGLAGQRHDITHGCAFGAGGNELFVFRLATSKNTQTPKFYTMTVGQLQGFYRRVEALDELAVGFLRDLYLLTQSNQ